MAQLRQVHRVGIKAPGTHTILRLPEDAQIIHFDYQQERNEFSVWYTTRNYPKYKDIKVRIFATGEDIPDGAKHIGTNMQGGFYMWHLFQLS